MLHPVFASIDPSVFISSCIETGVFIHTRVNKMISEFSINAFSLLNWNHSCFLSDLFSSSFVHGLSKFFLELNIFLCFLLINVLTHKDEGLIKSYKIKIINGFIKLRIYLFINFIYIKL
jgi:hypothetical protein